jgi:hypothetical protein
MNNFRLVTIEGFKQSLRSCAKEKLEINLFAKLRGLVVLLDRLELKIPPQWRRMLRAIRGS